MTDVVNTRIKAFGKLPKANFVSPSEQLITLTIGQLEELVTRAIEPLKAELSDTRAIITQQAEDMAVLETIVTTLSDNQLIQLRLIGQLREATKKDPQPLQKDRAEILSALLAANGGKMLAKDVRLKMHLSKELFSMLISSMNDYIETKPLHSDNRKNLLILKTA